MVFKIITIKKRGGGTRKQRVQVLASGKFKFVKNSAAKRGSSQKRRKTSISSGPKRRKSTTKAVKRKSNKPPKRRVNVVKRRKASSRRSRSIQSKIPFVNNPTIRKVATGIGLATIGTAVIGLVLPQFANNPIIKPALAFLGGGIPGVIGQVVVGGGIGGLTQIIGGNTTSNNQASGGFA